MMGNMRRRSDASRKLFFILTAERRLLRTQACKFETQVPLLRFDLPEVARGGLERSLERLVLID